ncbi:MAG: hypothetical protein HY619_08115 [Thaumarchaeota archaeon]|nr:hypothetical protein [Nitrososphaerota archaeon]
MVSTIVAVIGTGLLITYVKNLRHAKTKFTAGLVLFAAVVVAENIATAYVYFELAQTYTAVVATPLLVLKAIELSGFTILSWITLKL